MTAISFKGNCDEAITYYKEVLGAEVKTINYFRDAPQDVNIGDLKPNCVLYSEVSIFGTPIVMVDDEDMPQSGQRFWLQLTFDTPEEVTSVFNKLADGGTIVKALKPEFWAALDGNVNDRFGVHWSILTNH